MVTYTLGLTFFTALVAIEYNMQEVLYLWDFFRTLCGDFSVGVEVI